MHERVRTELWGHAATSTSNRPTVVRVVPWCSARVRLSGPAGPHGKGDVVRIADAPAQVDVVLTESFAMWPGSSVSGLYLAHPDSRYRCRQEYSPRPVESYAAREGPSIEEAETQSAPARRLRLARLPPRHRVTVVIVPIEAVGHYERGQPRTNTTAGDRRGRRHDDVRRRGRLSCPRPCRRAGLHRRPDRPERLREDDHGSLPDRPAHSDQWKGHHRWRSAHDLTSRRRSRIGCRFRPSSATCPSGRTLHLHAPMYRLPVRSMEAADTC